MLQITPLIQERIKTLRDVATVADFFFVDELPPYDPRGADPAERRCGHGADGSEACLRNPGEDRVYVTMPWTQRCAPGPRTLKIKTGQMFQPIRVAVCGRKNAPPLFETLEVLGREACLHRHRPARFRCWQQG